MAFVLRRFDVKRFYRSRQIAGRGHNQLGNTDVFTNEQ